MTWIPFRLPVISTMLTTCRGFRGRVALKPLGYVAFLVAVRVVNAWFYDTPLDVFIQRTVMFIVLAYVVSNLRARRRRHVRTL
jgi:hypothetical protein